jgi:hypothetical protein
MVPHQLLRDLVLDCPWVTLRPRSRRKAPSSLPPDLPRKTHGFFKGYGKDVGTIYMGKVLVKSLDYK